LVKWPATGEASMPARKKEETNVVSTWLS
jgi:hypothetical protein